MKKTAVIGVFVGIILGVFFQFLFPNFLKQEALFKIQFRQELGLPVDYPLASGSVLSVGFLLPLLLGLVGGVAGIIFSKIKQKTIYKK